MTPRFTAWLFYLINYAITVYGFVQMLTPRYGRLKTSFLQLGFAAGILLAVWPLLLDPVPRALVTIPLLFIVFVLLYHGKFWYKALAYFFMELAEVLSDALTWPILSLVTGVDDLDQLNSYAVTPLTLTGRTIYALILFVLVTALVTFWNLRASSRMQRREQSLTLFAALLIFVQVIFVTLTTFAASTTVDGGFIATTILLDISAFIMLFVFFDFFKDHVSYAAHTEAMKAQRDIQRRYAADMAVYAQSVRQIRSQLSGTLEQIQNALENDALETLDVLAGNCAFEVRQLPHQYSDSVAVNSLMLEKQRLAESRGITFSCHSRLDATGISEFSLCSILSNLLDNAIDAAGRASGRQWISVNSYSRAGLHTIVCTNAYTPGLRKRAGGGDHGLGLPIVRSTAAEYGGTLHLDAGKDRFTAVVAFLKEDDDLPQSA